MPDEADRATKVAQGVTQSMRALVLDVSSQPSVGLYFVQKHNSATVPKLVKQQTQVLELARAVQRGSLEVADAVACVGELQLDVTPLMGAAAASLRALREKHPDLL